MSSGTAEILTVPEVASYLRVTTKTVYSLVKRGELPSFRVGRAVRCRREDVEAFIERQSAEAASVRPSERPKVREA